MGVVGPLADHDRVDSHVFLEINNRLCVFIELFSVHEIEGPNQVVWLVLLDGPHILDGGPHSRNLHDPRDIFLLDSADDRDPSFREEIEDLPVDAPLHEHYVRIELHYPFLQLLRNYMVVRYEVFEFDLHPALVQGILDYDDLGLDEPVEHVLDGQALLEDHPLDDLHVLPGVAVQDLDGDLLGDVHVAALRVEVVGEDVHPALYDCPQQVFEQSPSQVLRTDVSQLHQPTKHLPAHIFDLEVQLLCEFQLGLLLAVPENGLDGEELPVLVRGGVGLVVLL